MDVKKKYHKKFLKTYISYIVFIIATISVAILSYIFVQSEWSYVLIFSLLFLLLAMSYRFKKSLYLIIHESYIENIKEDVMDPIELNDQIDMISIQRKLLKDGYDLTYTGNDYVLLTKIVKDAYIRKIFQHHILYVAMIAFDDKATFYQQKVDDIINEIQFKSQTEDKKRIDRLLISQYKPIKTFNDQERQRVNEIIFIKTDKHIVSTINIGIVESPHIALMLASKTFRPSSYYQLHIDTILSSLK